MFAAIADRIEHEAAYGRDIDADIYEAFGYQVKRAPEGRNGISWRYFNLQDRRWISMEHLTHSVDECSRFIERRFPAWSWTVSNCGPSEEPHAIVTLGEEDRLVDVEGSAIRPPMALAAALCRAQALRADRR